MVSYFTVATILIQISIIIDLRCIEEKVLGKLISCYFYNIDVYYL